MGNPCNYNDQLWYVISQCFFLVLSVHRAHRKRVLLVRTYTLLTDITQCTTCVQHTSSHPFLEFLHISHQIYAKLQMDGIMQLPIHTYSLSHGNER